MIPMRLHQSWKDAAVPARWLDFQASWRRHHPDWEYRLWTDEDNRAFVAGHCPALLPLYESYPLPINRAELARYLVLRQFGGVYADLDFECLRPVGPLLEHSFVVGLEPESHAARAAAKHPDIGAIHCNAFVASIPGHPFWDHLLRCLEASRNEPDVLTSTGVLVFSRACATYDGKPPITVLPAEQLYPADLDAAKRLGPEALGAMAGSAYGIHHWSGSWWRDAILRNARDRLARDRLAAGGAGRAPVGM